MHAVKLDLGQEKDINPIMQRLPEGFLEFIIDALEILSPDDSPCLGDDPSFRLFYQVRVTMPGIAVKVQLVHFRFDPISAAIPFCQGFADAVRNFPKGKYSMVMISGGHGAGSDGYYIVFAR